MEQQDRPSLTERVSALSETDCVLAAEQISKDIIASTSLEKMMATVPGTVRSDPQFVGVLAEVRQPENAVAKLTASESAQFARTLLTALANDPETAPAVEAVLDRLPKLQAVGVILSAGVACSLLLLAASVEFAGKLGGIEFRKTKLSPKLVRELLRPMTALFGGSTDAG